MIDYSIDANARLVYVRMTDVCGLMDLALHTERLLAEPSFQMDFDTFVDVDEEACFEVASWSQQGAAMLENWAERRSGVKWALVVRRETQRAIIRILLSHFRLGTVSVEVFADEVSAWAWLGKGPFIPAFEVVEAADAVAC